MALTFFLIWYLYFYSDVSNIADASPVLRNTWHEESGTLNPPFNVCLTETCNRTAEEILNNMDIDVDPCKNFYKFACGKFIKKTTIPEDEFVVNPYSLTSNTLHDQLRQLLEEESPADEKKHFKLAKNFYAGCINTTAIEEKGLKPLLDVLNELGGWPALEGDTWVDANFSWIQTVYRMINLGFPTTYLLDLGIDSDVKNSSKSVLSLTLPPLHGLRDNSSFQAYQAYVIGVAVLLGADRDQVAEELLEAILFEKNLTNITQSKLENTSMTIAELMQEYPSIPWMEYIQQQLPNSLIVDENEVIVVDNPNYIFNLEKLTNRTAKRVQANYLMYRAALNFVRLLTDDAREVYSQYQKVINANVKLMDRWKECIDTISTLIPSSIYSLYIQNYFTDDTKENVVEMVDYIKKQFGAILQNVDWMDDETRQRGLEKLDAMTSLIGYTDDLMNDDKLEEIFEGLELDENEFFYSFLNVSHFHRLSTFKKLRGFAANDSQSLFDGILCINAYYIPQRNTIVLPAPILQGQFFHNERPKYMNYGAIGFIIGHEITHGFDSTGRKYDKNGNLVNDDWWVDETEDKFTSKIQCLTNQYDNYTVEEVGLNLNGSLTLDENIADNGGIKIAYRAYHEWLKLNGPELLLPDLPYSSTQMFWISAANIWCAKPRNEYLSKIIRIDEHSSSEFRVNPPLSNIPDLFSKDFHCPVGSKMNPKKTCTVW